ncbi:MAG: nitroreductase family protein [Burkholderiales bacterium]|nr:nitroreductase family protein [Burkholderiales bacterium]MDE2159020.1 nitroreductase family protein [Burkholderiales bacterium]MDE2503804.1 nitroreductase family protein [Burkholderiales bacterium]
MAIDPGIPQAYAALLAAHRSIRRFEPRPVDPALVDRLLEQSLQGASSSGNLNLVSVVKSSDPGRRRRLHELHGGQDMVLEAPLLLTFCADTDRTRLWLAQRGARAGFADFLSWHVAAFDAIILAQTTALALESQGLGICYMGTTINRMTEIAAALELPGTCLPVTTLVVGWPAEAPAQRDRLPRQAWIHDEVYRRPAPAEIDRDYGERESRGWARYRSMGPEVIERMDALGITSLAQFYTSPIKYDPDRLGEYSVALEALLRERGFLPAAP